MSKWSFVLLHCQDTYINNLTDNMRSCSGLRSRLLNITSASKSCRKSPAGFNSTATTLNGLGLVYNVQRYKHMQSKCNHFWSGVVTGCLQIYVFKHGPVNIYGAEESKERCNDPPRAARCNQPSCCTTALQKQTHKLSLSLSHKQILPQSSQGKKTQMQKSVCLLSSRAVWN